MSQPCILTLDLLARSVIFLDLTLIMRSASAEITGPWLVIKPALDMSAFRLTYD